MQLELQGKVAVVTGASPGIGLAVTTALAGKAPTGRRSRDGSKELDALVASGSAESVMVDCPRPQARLTSPRRRSPEGRSTSRSTTSGGPPPRRRFSQHHRRGLAGTMNLNLMAAVGSPSPVFRR